MVIIMENIIRVKRVGNNSEEISWRPGVVDFVRSRKSWRRQPRIRIQKVATTE